MVFKGALIVQEGTFIYSYIQTCFGLYTDLYSSILQSEFESQIQALTGTQFGFHLGRTQPSSKVKSLSLPLTYTAQVQGMFTLMYSVCV